MDIQIMSTLWVLIYLFQLRHLWSLRYLQTRTTTTTTISIHPSPLKRLRTIGQIPQSCIYALVIHFSWSPCRVRVAAGHLHHRPGVGLMRVVTRRCRHWAEIGSCWLLVVLLYRGGTIERIDSIQVFIEGWYGVILPEESKECSSAEGEYG